MLEQSRNGRNRFVLGLVPCEIERGLRVEFAMQVFIGDVAWKSPDRGRWGHETKESLSSFSNRYAGPQHTPAPIRQRRGMIGIRLRLGLLPVRPG